MNEPSAKTISVKTDFGCSVYDFVSLAIVYPLDEGLPREFPTCYTLPV